MNTLVDGLRLMFAPVGGWFPIARENDSVARLLLLHTAPLALVPAVCWYYGVTHSGWSIVGEPMRLTAASALPMCIAFYFAMVFGVLFMGYMVRWMSVTYGDRGSLAQGVRLITYAATPFFLSGIVGVAPVLWFDLLVGVFVASYCLFLLYTGVTPIMRVGRERGFLYASAVLAVALVAFVGLLSATTFLWEYVMPPEYTY